jgi:hypothetical protein
VTEDEWRNEAKILHNILVRHREIMERFIKRVHQCVPRFSAAVEAEELFDRISEGIEDLSMKKDALAAENKDLHLAIEKKCNEKHNTEAFCAAAMQRFPNLQKKYEVRNDNFTFYYQCILSALDRLSDPLYRGQSRNCSL